MNKRAKVSLASGVMFSIFLERNNPAIPSQGQRQFADSSKVFKQKIKKKPAEMPIENTCKFV